MTATPAQRIEAAWLPVLGYEGSYEVSDNGEVRSLDRYADNSFGGKSAIRGRLLKGRPLSTGHLIVALYKDAKPTGLQVHRLVLTAFVRTPREGELGLHRDDDPLNNSLTNLRWGNVSMNMQDRVRNGRDPNTRKTHCPKGHGYSPENTYTFIGRSGGLGRQCRECNRQRNRSRRALADAIISGGTE